MPESAYIAIVLGVAIAITVTLRALPFLVKGALADSPLLDDIGRWMPIGAVMILALYCVSRIDFGTSAHGLPELAGIAATVGVHAWRRNAVLSILAGTAVCVLVMHLI